MCIKQKARSLLIGTMLAHRFIFILKLIFNMTTTTCRMCIAPNANRKKCFLYEDRYCFFHTLKATINYQPLIVFSCFAKPLFWAVFPWSRGEWRN